ncbi:MAG: HNH endonuclease [Sedimentisphaerales bacterium]
MDKITITLSIPVPKFIIRFGVAVLLAYRLHRFGCAFRKIALTQGKFAIVDQEDFEELNTHKWYAAGCANNFYAVRVIGRINGRKKHISMHRQITQPPPGFVVDHKDGDGLNNRRENLRVVTETQNHYNSRKCSKTTSSKYKGVCYDKQRNKFRAEIKYNGHRKFLGHFDNEIDAAKAYDKAAKLYYGEFAKLNFP